MVRPANALFSGVAGVAECVEVEWKSHDAWSRRGQVGTRHVLFQTFRYLNPSGFNRDWLSHQWRRSLSVYTCSSCVERRSFHDLDIRGEHWYQGVLHAETDSGWKYDYSASGTNDQLARDKTTGHRVK